MRRTLVVTALAALAGLFLWPAAAGAQQYPLPPGPPPEVAPIVVEPGPAPTGPPAMEVAPTVLEAPPADAPSLLQAPAEQVRAIGLPVTGGDLVGLLVLAVAAIALGAALVGGARRVRLA